MTDVLTEGHALTEFLSIGRSSQLSVHHVEPGVLFDLMQDGRLTELKRERRQAPTYDGEDAYYLVGKGECEGTALVLFSDDLPAA